MVSPAHRDSIAAAVNADNGLAGIHWIFPEVAFWPLRQGIEPKWERTYNLLWQQQALRAAKDLQRRVGFDLIHHLTWGGLRAPTFLGSLGVPLIVGPMGGGETSPRSLRDRLPTRGRVLELLRDLSNATIEINPIVRPGLRHAAVIFVKTADTRDALSQRLRRKTAVMMELVVHAEQLGAVHPRRQSHPRLLYAGRLLYWKGVHIAIETMAALVKQMPDAVLTIVGSGTEEARLKAEVQRKGLTANIKFVSWIPQTELLQLYDSHDFLLFPSLHDSTGGVVLEALCRGLPVACLDLGGPKDIVTPQSGIVAGTAGLNTAQVATRLADRLHEVFNAPDRLAELSAGAIARAHDFLLPDQITRLYETAWQMIEHGARNTTSLKDKSKDKSPGAATGQAALREH